MGNLIENERIKLAANAFDRLSTALATLGVITPFAALIYGSDMALKPEFALSVGLWGRQPYI
ncbi:MAG: hypothetical protein ABIY37_17470 [Devosia sp.]